MSKVNKKIQMGYEPKPKHPMCSNCIHYRSDFIENKWKYTEEKNIHCDYGGFAVKKSANCNVHEFKSE